MPTVVLHPKKEQRVYSGHPWVFRSDIDRVEGPCQDGDVVRVDVYKRQVLYGVRANCRKVLIDPNI